MRPSTFAALVVVVPLIALAPLPAQAQSSAREAITGAIREFGEAVVAGDGERLTDAIWVSEHSVADATGRDLFVRLVLAERSLERVAGTRWGTAGSARFRCHYPLLYTPDDRAALAAADISPEHNGTVWVQRPNETYPIRCRRGTGGRWQVVLDILDMELEDDLSSTPIQPDPRSRCRLNQYRAMAEGVEDVAERVEKGEYATPAAAEADVVARFEKALADYIAARNALSPGRRPFRHYR